MQLQVAQDDKAAGIARSKKAAERYRGIAATAGLADPKMKARFSELGGVPAPMSPADFGKMIADETEKWGKVVKFAGIKPE